MFSRYVFHIFTSEERPFSLSEGKGLSETGMKIVLKQNMELREKSKQRSKYWEASVALLSGFVLVVMDVV
jgi:hypothetical protein